jgi:hypothetical protein
VETQRIFYAISEGEVDVASKAVAVGMLIRLVEYNRWVKQVAIGDLVWHS